jgi:aminoglycoside phosphotransferase (APT) family kinase protein
MKPGRDIAELTRALEGWLADQPTIAGPVAIERIAPADGGVSSETWLIDAAGAERQPLRWVLRIEPRGHQIYEDPSVERQFHMIRALTEHTDLPIPAALACEADEQLLGAPFFLMERAEGTTPPESYHAAGMFADAAPARREAMWRDSIALLAGLHRAPVEPFRFLAFAPERAGDDGLAQELLRWDSYLRWTRLPRSALFERARRWLEDHRPASSGIGVAWGDARPRNMLYLAGRPTAMLDWETASLGGAETDLGWWITYDRMVTDIAGIPRLDGLGSPEQTVALWEEYAGRKAVAMEWHLVFASYRFALISEQAIALLLAAGRCPPEAAGAGNPAVKLLAELVPG